MDVTQARVKNLGIDREYRYCKYENRSTAIIWCKHYSFSVLMTFYLHLFLYYLLKAGLLCFINIYLLLYLQVIVYRLIRYII